MRPKTIAVDLDGTIYHQKAWNRDNIGVPIPGAREELQKFIDAGWHVVIYTARLPEDWDNIESTVQADGIPYTRLWRKEGKPLADVYLDDRAITFDGNWARMFQRVEGWNPWFGDKFLRPPAGSDDEQLTRSR